MISGRGRRLRASSLRRYATINPETGLTKDAVFALFARAPYASDERRLV